MPFDKASDKLMNYMRNRSLDPGPNREARGWYMDAYASTAEMREVWKTDQDNAEWRKYYGAERGKQSMKGIGATRRKVGWTALGRRDHHAQFLADNGSQLRPNDLQTKYPMLRSRWSVLQLQRIKNIVKRLLAGASA